MYDAYAQAVSIQRKLFGSITVVDEAFQNDETSVV